jgi:hypothetical protein
LWLVAAWPAAAHHGGDVEWADSAVGPITGTATKFAFQFPHVFFEMDVAEQGGVALWTITLFAARRQAARRPDGDRRGQRPVAAALVLKRCALRPS